MSYEGARVLITGVKGFTGRYMAAELLNNGAYEVVGIGTADGEGSDYKRVDLRDYEALKAILRVYRPEMVVHLAALAFVGHGNPDDFYRVNLLGTRNLLRAIEQSGVVPKAVLVASSANVYGNASVSMLSEDAPVAPMNDYAVSKLAMEYMVSLWRNRLPLIITRPFNYTGVGQDPSFLLAKITDHFRRREGRIQLGNMDIARDFSDVRTVVHLYRRLLEAPSAIGCTVNVSSGVSHTLREVIAICEDIAGYRIDVEINPAFVRANEVKALCGDNARMRSLVGEWSAVPLRSTLEWMLASN